MIKCFIVQNTWIPENHDGKFKEGKFYIAKISCNAINTISVLDYHGTWVPFKWRRGPLKIENFDLYFDIWDEFLIENKKELNKYILLTKFYE